ncbi:hypothetical protein [Microbacterium resistens]|uniref:hypothetical protein n=1 Tax=Microbacterium resistens TaxID=156977 RepID=UPI00082ED80D|nr:hypothetical protein [Microbacterium resistens]
MASPTSSARPRRGLAVAALVLGVVTAAVAAIGWALTLSTPGMGSLSVMILAAIAVWALALATAIVAVVALIRAPAKILAVIGLVLALVPAVIAVAWVVPLLAAL